MGGFMGIGGSSAKTDRKSTLAGFGDLSNVFSFGLDTAKGGAQTDQATTNQGVNAMGSSLGYWQKLASGNRTAMNSVVAPQTNAVNAQADAQRRGTAAAGTARGGGNAGVQQQQHTDAMAKIDNLLMQAQPEAATQEAKVGGEIAGVGQSEMNQAMNALGLGEKAASDLTGESVDSRKVSLQANQQAVSQVMNTIGAVAGAFA